MNVKILKKLGSGMVGIVYLSEIDGKKAITKIEKYNGDLTTRSPFIRQLIFNDQVAKHYPDRFMTLVSSGIVNDCKFDRKLLKPSYELKDKDFDKCFVLSYRPVLKYTLKEIRDELTPKKKLKIFKHLETTISIMHEKGFFHRDIHMENVMCDESLDKWYLIDYGSVKHKSFIKNEEDKKFFLYYSFPDIIALMRHFIENPVSDYIFKKLQSKKCNSKKNFTHFQKALSILKKDYIYEEIKKFLPKKKLSKIITNQIIEMICCLTNYDSYIKIFCTDFMNTKVAKDNMNLIQPNRDYFLRVIKNL